MDLPTRGIICLIGGFILLLSFASDFSYGNINTYMISYMRTTGYEDEDGEFKLYNPGLTYADFLFVSVSKTLIQGASMPFLGALARKMGTRLSIFIGSMIYSSGFLLTGLSSRYSFPWAVVTLSMHGLGFSLVYATAIGAAQNWFPAHMKGLIGSLVLCGYGFGSLIWIPIQTNFVNPLNKNATQDPSCQDNEGNCDFYFTDDEVLDRVPNMFILLGGIFTVMGLISTLLISDVKGPSDECVEMVATAQEKKKMEVEVKRESLTPLQVIMTPTFYMIWAGFFSISLSWGILQNFSKTYGLTIINDDHYYVTIGIVSNVFNGLCRVCWGALYDKLNFRGCYLMLGTVVTVIIAIFPLLQYLEENSMEAKICYGLLSTILYMSFPGIYAIIAATINDAFGPDHYQANFGLLFTQSIVYAGAIFIITKIPVIYAFLGYTGMFLTAAVIGVLGLILVAFLPKQLNSNEIKKKYIKKS